jgi:stage II sporulation protein D
VQAVNIVALDTYLRGVVPSEIVPSWPMEALKAQAVAARSYAWPKIKLTGSYDVLPTSANQVYRGVLNEHPRTDRAVAEAANLVLLYQGNVITAYYHTASGGATESSEYVWPLKSGKPGSVVPYIRGKLDVDANGQAYDRSYGKFEYTTASFTLAQLSTIMSKNSATDVGQIQSVTFDRGVGRVYRVTLVGSKGTKVVNGGTFRNTYNNNRLAGGTLNSTMYWLLPVSP